MASPLPQVQYLVGFGNGPLDDHTSWTVGTTVAAGQWTDITNFVYSCQIQRGRQHELDRFQAGTCTLETRNLNGEFNPWNASSPFAGHLIPMKQLQVRAIWQSVTYYLYTGHVTSWATTWPDEVSQWAEIQSSDGFRFLNQALLSSTTYPTKVLSDGASFYFRCNDPPGSTTLADQGPPNDVNGVLQPGTQAPIPAFSTDSPLLLTPGSGSITFSSFNNAGGQNWVLLPDAGFVPLPFAQPLTVECWFKLQNVAPGNTINMYGDNVTSGTATNALYFFYTPVNDLLGNAPAVTFAIFDAAGNEFTVSGAVSDSNWHHVACTFSGTAGGPIVMYLDGVATETTPGPTSWSFAFNPPHGVAIGSAATNGDFSNGGSSLAEVALYQGTAITAAQASNHHLLGIGFAQEATDARVGHVLDAVGWPAGLRNLGDGGLQLCQANTQNLLNTSALSFLQVAETTEGGALFMDGFGRVKFMSRDVIGGRDALTGAPGVAGAVQAWFGDSVNGATAWKWDVSKWDQATWGTNHIPFNPGPDLALDDQDIVNQVVATRQGGQAQVANDLVSQHPSLGYGPRSRSLDGLLHLSDATSAAHATWLVAKLAQPITRLRSINVNLIDLLSNPTQVAQVLALDLMYRIQVERVQAGFLQIALIEAITTTITPDSWNITYALSPTDIYPYWSWGNLV